MPLHDWTRVGVGIFHDFHLAWMVEIARALNGGLLPADYDALIERVVGDDPDGSRTELELYTARQRQIAIRHTSGDRVVALIEIVSAGNKAGEYPWQTFLDKMLGALHRGVHLLILDVYPPTPRDPDGVHGSLWGQLAGEEYHAPADADRTLAAYAAGFIETAHVEPVAVGGALRDMPLFLTPDGYVLVPLEATYRLAYEGVPQRYRRLLEAAG